MLKSAQRQSGRRQTAGLHGRAGCPTTRARQHIKGSNADWNGIVKSLLLAICLDSAGCPRALSTPSDDVTAQLYTLFVHSEVQAKRQEKEAYMVVPNCGGPTSEQRPSCHSQLARRGAKQGHMEIDHLPDPDCHSMLISYI